MLDSLKEFGVDAPITFVDHHTGHAFSAIVTSGYKKGIFVTLDAEGDGDSGSIGNFRNEQGKFIIEDLCKIPAKDSLGYLYSATTKRYNFKPYSHEGKITGLAAYGTPGESYKFLKRYIKVRKGLPVIRTPRSRILRFLKLGLRYSGVFPHAISSVQDVVDSASTLCQEYPDLASSTQAVLEETVLSMVSSRIMLKEKTDIVLAGGVFSNVRLNEKIALSNSINRCFIYPNMGDGGLSVGAIYKYLSDSNNLLIDNSYRFNAYTGPEIDFDDVSLCNAYLSKDFKSPDLWVEQLVKHLGEGDVIGLIQGQAEFGPRALMNRSIIADPTDKSLNTVLNTRLRRTEFMPFAPVVRVERFLEIFHADQIKDLTPFMFMTMTCLVRKEWVSRLGAVVHIDGTARPQVVTYESNPLAWEILKAYEDKTGIPCLINTSFNIHEEPIVNSAQDVIEALNNNMIDLVATPYTLLYKSSS